MDNIEERIELAEAAGGGDSMSAVTGAKLVGETGRITVTTSSGGNLLSVRVKIQDLRSVYGRVDALVTPVEGTHEAWVDASRIRWDDGEAKKVADELLR